MDAAQKLLKASAILLALASLMAAPGWAQTLQVQSTSVTLGSPTFTASTGVSSSDGTTVINYTVAVSYSNDTTNSGSWLVVTPTGATTTAATPTLNFGIRNNSTAGINTGAMATVTLTPTGPSGVSTTAVDITVTFNSAGGGGGSTTLTASPSGTINLSANANSTAAQNVAITTASSSTLNLSLAVAVSSGVASWLSASLSTPSITSSAGATLTITGNSANLTSGLTYTGTVTLTPSTGTPLVINVSFTVGASVTNGVWTATPGTMGWTYTINSNSFPTQSITVSTTNTLSATYSVVTSSTGGWLLAYLPSVANSNATTISNIGVGTPFGLTVGSAANSLQPGQYLGQTTIYDSSNVAQITVSVTMTVSNGTTTALTVTPNPITFTAALNSAQQSQQVNAYSSAGGVLSVNTASLPTGVSAVWTSQTIAAGGTATFTVYANPAGLAANTYGGNLIITIGSQSATVPVSMVVGGGGTGTTAVAPTSLNFFYQLGTDPINFISRQKLAITGSPGAWSSSIFVYEGSGWIHLTPANGTALPDPSVDSQTPIVSIDATGLTAGTYTGTITITTAGGGTQNISVTLTVGSSAVLLTTPGSLVFSAKTGQAKPSAQILYVSPSSSTLYPLSIAATSNNAWITVTNDTSSVTVQADQTGFTAGVYTGSVSVTQSGAANSPLTIPVVMVVGSGGGGNGGNVTVAPTALTFTAPAGTSPASQTISVTSASGTSGIPFTVAVTTTNGGNWLVTNAGSLNTTPFPNLTVTVSSNSLAATTYNGNIVITPTGGNPVTIPVSLTITPAATVTATPTTLNFSYMTGGSAPAAQQIAVSGNGGTLAFTATASSTGNWLVVSPASGTTPGTVSVSISGTGLSAGNYTGAVVVNGASGATGSTTITVTLSVTTPLPTITKVTNAASYATGSISPGEIITLFAADPTHPIGPATPAGLTLDSTGKVSTSIGGVQVLIQGYACPMVYASATQVSAVVPYEVKQLTNASILIKYLGASSNGVPVNVATTAPGIFTANSSGTGPGAILNSDYSFNAPANPAPRGSTVVLYLTGEGETSPFGVTGKVTTVASAPPLTPTPLLQPSVTIGGQPAAWNFAGEAPTFVSGVLQMNVQIPTNIAAGDQPIVVSIGSNPSQQGVTVSVK